MKTNTPYFSTFFFVVLLLLKSTGCTNKPKTIFKFQFDDKAVFILVPENIKGDIESGMMKANSPKDAPLFVWEKSDNAIFPREQMPEEPFSGLLKTPWKKDSNPGWFYFEDDLSGICAKLFLGEKDIDPNEDIEAHVLSNIKPSLTHFNHWWTILICLIASIALLSNWYRIIRMDLINKSMNHGESNKGIMIGLNDKKGNTRNKFLYCWVGLKKLVSEKNLENWDAQQAAIGHEEIGGNTRYDAWDVGLFGLGLSVLFWAVNSLVLETLKEVSLFGDRELALGRAIFSLCNSALIWLSLPYVQKLTPWVKTLTTQLCRPWTVLIAGLIVVGLTLKSYFSSKVAPLEIYLPDIFFDTVTGLLLAGVLYDTFVNRALSWNAWFAVLAAILAIGTQIWEVVTPEWSMLNAFGTPFLMIVYKTLLIMLFFQLGYSWREIKMNDELERSRALFKKIAPSQKSESNINGEIGLSEDEEFNKLKSINEERGNLNAGITNLERREVIWKIEKIHLYVMNTSVKSKFLLVSFPNDKLSFTLPFSGSSWDKLVKLALRKKFGTGQDIYETCTGDAGDFSYQAIKRIKDALNWNNSIPEASTHLLDITSPPSVNQQIALSCLSENISFIGSLKLNHLKGLPDSIIEKIKQNGMV